MFLEFLNTNFNSRMIFACGPSSLMNDARRVSTLHNAYFYDETFEF